MEKFLKNIRENNTNVYRVTVIKDGASKTVEINQGNACNNSYSVAKVFTSTAIGMVFDSGLLDEDETVFSMFADKFPKEYDKKWEKVTVRNLLQHKMGVDRSFLDIDVEDISAYGNDFLSASFSIPLPYEPGEKYAYSDGAYYLLSRIVTHKTGIKLDDYLMERLFVPLRFQEAAWSKCPLGYPLGATGLYLRTDDMAKIGTLYLNYGVYDGKRIISDEWVKKTLENDYGFNKLKNKNACAKGGMLGQMIYVSYDDNKVIACHSYDRQDKDFIKWII